MEVLAYDKATGAFTWKKRLNRRIRIGALAGTSTSAGYVSIGIDGAHYFAHRLAWLYVTGKPPKEEIDHADGNKANNAWLNLREATRKQNNENLAPVSKANTSGIRGVNFYPRTGRWRAFIGNNGKRIHLGFFGSKAEAVAARVAAEAVMFTHLRAPSVRRTPSPR